MKNFIFICGLSLLLSSCAMVSYVGEKYPPSTSVEVFYSAHDVTKPYKVIGHMNYPAGVGTDAVKAKFIAYGKSIGADAIVITGNNGLQGSEYAYVTADALKYN
ncbi:MAG: hypothetical protein JSU01_07795 [Bacteroidetes bacterium]|nr:hypothetical protein [Bacteroidota bacterium]